MTPARNTEQRSIVVTGVSKGLGRALADRLMADGHRVFGCARSQGATSTDIHYRVVDVARDDEVARWAREVLEQGTPDLIINNAALINRPAPLWAVPAEEFDAVTAVNLNGVANVIRHFVPAMIEGGGGVIANLSSGWGRSTSSDVAPYCTTKWGIEGLSAALADDLPAGLASVAVNPGVIDTEMLRTCWGDGAAGYENPDVWAERAAPFFLALGASENGQALTVP